MKNRLLILSMTILISPSSSKVLISRMSIKKPLDCRLTVDFLVTSHTEMRKKNPKNYGN